MTTNLPDLLTAIHEHGIALTVRLVVDAPAGALAPELREALAAHKPLLLQRIAREMAWEELRSWRWGPARDNPEPGIEVPSREFENNSLAKARSKG